MKKEIIFCFTVIIFAACSPSVKTKMFEDYSVSTSSDVQTPDQIAVLGLDKSIPPNAVQVGTVKVGDSGFTTKCGWEEVIGRAKLEAQKAGANAIKITRHRRPSAFGSTCHRIEAVMIVSNDVEDMDLSPNPMVDETWDYAKLYVYRGTGQGFLIGYDLHFNETKLGRVKVNSAQEFRLREEGKHTLWATTESRSEVTIDLEFGREYYLRCDIKTGIMVGRPHLELVDAAMAKPEYDSIMSKSK